MKLLCIAGPTAVGKTNLALKFKDANIISCDSVMIYKELNITTNKENEEIHKLMNLKSFNETYDVELFVSDFLKCLDNDKLNILVGGCGLYMERAILEYKKIFCTCLNYCIHLLKIFICCEREFLYRKIDERCEKMVLKGLFDEVKDLKYKGIDLKHFSGRSIGYRDALIFLNSLGDCESENKKLFLIFLENFKRRTRNYARKQETWFRNRGFFWINIKKYDAFDIVSKNNFDRIEEFFLVHENSKNVNLNAKKLLKTYVSCE
ncbi:hypothetical protein GVAV_002843 [Gurleya vavrai]